MPHETNGHAATARPLFRKSLETQILEDRLRKASIGEVVTYDDLGDAAGCEVRPQHPGYAALRSARESLSRHAGIEFECVQKVGLKRLNDGEIVGARAKDISSIRRRARDSRRKLANADPSKLNAQQVLEFNTSATLLAFLGRMSTRAATKKISAAVAEAGEKLPLGRTLELFRRG